MKKYFLFISIFILGLASSAQAQTLPQEVISYLNKNYKGWKLSPTTENCATGFTNEGFITSDFNGDGKPDYAVKFIRSKKGYLLAFLIQKNGFKTFVLHKTDAEM